MPNRRTARITSTCETCGNIFEHVSRIQRRFCSVRCASGKCKKIEYINKTCPVCDSTFSIQPHEKKRIYCSITCANTRNNDKRIYGKCRTCSTQFQIVSGQKLYCSKRCRDEYRKPKEIKCPICQKGYVPHSKQKFCSPSCRAIARQNKVEFQCVVCSKTFRDSPTRVGRKHYCSRSCQLKHQFYSHEEKKVIDIMVSLINEPPLCQHSFPWLVSKRKRLMHVDAYFPLHNLVVEYDGKQHRKFMPHYHKTQKQFNELKERDTLKEKLLLDHGISILRISDVEPRTSEYIQQQLDTLMMTIG
jgi:hypothetical protein